MASLTGAVQIAILPLMCTFYTEGTWPAHTQKGEGAGKNEVDNRSVNGFKVVHRDTKKPQIRSILRKAAQGTRDIRASMKSLTLGFEDILNTAQEGVMDIEKTKVSSTMQGLNAQVDSILGTMNELADVVMGLAGDVAMMPGDEIDHAIVISDDEDNTHDSLPKVEIPELSGIKT